MNRQTQVRQPVHDGLLPCPQRSLSVSKKQKIVHVADVACTVEFSFHKMVKGIQITVRPELAGEIADGQTSRPVDGKEVVAGSCGYGYVLPGTKRQFSAPVKKESLAAGTYTARVRVGAGQLKAVMSNEQRVAYKPSSPPQKKPDQKVSRDGKSISSIGGSGKAAPTGG